VPQIKTELTRDPGGELKSLQKTVGFSPQRLSDSATLWRQRAMADFAVGTRAWAAQEDGSTYELGTVAEVGAAGVTMDLPGGARTVARTALFHPEPSAAGSRGVDDNTSLTHLNEPNLLENLRARFSSDLIYVSTQHPPLTPGRLAHLTPPAPAAVRFRCRPTPAPSWSL
jgi:hypothetical protein